MRNLTKYYLIAFYVFVLQFILFGFLWGDNNFFIISVVNLFVFILFMLLNKNKKTVKSLKKRKFNIDIKQIFRNYLFVIVFILLILVVATKVFLQVEMIALWQPILVFVVLFLFFAKDIFTAKIYFFKKLFLLKDFLFGISLIVFLSVFHLVNIPSILLASKLAIASFAGLIVFTLSIKISNAIGAYKVSKLLTTRLYLLLFIVASLIGSVQFYYTIANTQLINSPRQFKEFALDNIEQNVNRVYLRVLGVVQTGSTTDNVFEQISSTGSINTGKSVYIDTGYHSSGTLLDVTVSGDQQISTGDIGSGIVEELIKTGVQIVKEGEDEYLAILDTYKETDPLMYKDVLSYLIQKAGLTIDVNDRINFTYLSYTNPNYKYFVVAYKNKLIGKNTNPTGLVKCDNYLVMKGILSHWDVSKYNGNIFVKYYQKAKDINQDNGCILGQYVYKNNL